MEIVTSLQPSMAIPLLWVLTSVIPAVLFGMAISFFLFRRPAPRVFITQEHEQRQKALTELSKTLHCSLEKDQILKALGAFCAQHFCDWCNVYVFETTKVKRIGSFHHDSSKAQITRAFLKTEITSGLEQTILDVVATRKSLLKQNIEIPRLSEQFIDPEASSFFFQLGLRSFIIVPITREHQIFGAMTVIRSDQNFQERDREFFDDIASRAAAALENARLHQLALSAIKKREEVLAVVAHDLNNPLSAIRMGVDMISRHLDLHPGEDCRDEIQKRIEGVRHSVTLASSLTNRILDAAKIDSGNLLIDRRPIPPGLPIRNVARLFSQLAEEKSVQLQISIHCSTDIYADLDRITQVLNNLIGNALKFSPRGGKIVIGVNGQENDALFFVSDTGVGIKPEYLPHLFDKYWQTQQSSSKSLGLGLAIAQGIVFAHGGRIWAESEVGKGTTLYFTVPFNSTNS